MVGGFDPGALLGGSYPLADGTRIRLRLARAGDLSAIRELLSSEPGRLPAELDLVRLIHSDPRRRFVLCATALIDSRETLVGVGSIPLSRAGAPAPDLVVTDRRLGRGLRELVESALVGRAEAIARDRAA